MTITPFKQAAFIFTMGIIVFASCAEVGQIEKPPATRKQPIRQSEFVRRLKHTCDRTINTSYYAHHVPQNKRVTITTPEALDNYIYEYNGNSALNSLNDADIFCSNLYHAAVENHDNDYIVITALFNISKADNSPIKLSCFKEFIMNEYLYAYFAPRTPDKDHHFTEICNTLAKTVEELSQCYNQMNQHRTSMELIDFVLKERAQDIDPQLKKQLLKRYSQAERGEKDTPGEGWLTSRYWIEPGDPPGPVSEPRIERLIGSMESDIDQVNTYHEQAGELKQKGNLKGAIENQTQILQLLTELVEKYTRCSALIDSYASGSWTRGQHQRINTYKAYSSKEQRAAIFVKRANARFLHKDLHGAIDDYTRAIELKPDHATAFQLRGEAYLEAGKLDLAMESLASAISLNPQNARCHFIRGRIHKTRGDLGKAIAEYDQAIKLDPQYTAAFNNRGNTYFEMGKLRKAYQDQTRAMAIDPNHFLAYNNLAFLYASRKKGKKYLTYPMALTYAQKAILLKREWYTLNTLAAVYARGGEFDKAIEMETAACKLLKKMESATYLPTARELVESYRQGKNYIEWEAGKEKI